MEDLPDVWPCQSDDAHPAARRMLFLVRVYFHGFVDCDKLHIRYFGRNHFRNGVYLGIWHIEDPATITDNTAGRKVPNVQQSD